MARRWNHRDIGMSAPTRLMMACCLAAAFSLRPGPAASQEETVTLKRPGATYVFYKKGFSQLGNSGALSGILAKDALCARKGKRIVFAAGHELCLHDTGTPAFGYLAKNTALIVGGRRYLFGKHARIDLGESGAVEAGGLAADMKLVVGKNTVPFKKGAGEDNRITFSAKGTITGGFLSASAELLVGSKHYRFAGEIGFYESGQVEWGHLAADTAVTIGGNTITLAGGEYHTVEYYDTGEIMKAFLASPQTLWAGGAQVTLGSAVSFSRKGRITMGVLEKDTQFQGKIWPQYATVIFTYAKAGTLQKIELYHHPER